MIRLRHALETGLRHPLLGPLLLLFVGLMLAFVILHAVEHGVEGLLFSCAIVAAASLRLAVMLGRISRPTSPRPAIPGRAPPWRRLAVVPASRAPAVRLALPRRL